MKKIQKKTKWEAFSKRKQIDLARFLRNATTLEEALRIFEVNRIDPPSVASIVEVLPPVKELTDQESTLEEIASPKEEPQLIETKDSLKKKSKKKFAEDEEGQSNEEVKIAENDLDPMAQHEQQQ